MRICSYGGVKLAEIPDHGYRYSLIVKKLDEDLYALRYSDMPFYVINEDGVLWIEQADVTTGRTRIYDIENRKWGNEVVNDYFVGIPSTDYICIWTNSTLLYSDNGYTFMEASEPEVIFCGISLRLGIATGMGLKGFVGKEEPDG